MLLDSPSGLLFMGAPVTYMAGKYFLSDGKEITGDDLNKITQGDKREKLKQRKQRQE
jgi:hypothetical protein